MRHFQHGRLHASRRIKSAIRSSFSTHALTRALYLSRVYAESAAFAFVRMASRSALNALALSADAMSLLYFVIRSSMHVGLEPGVFGQSQSKSHGFGSSNVGGVVGGIGSHFLPAGG